MPIADLGGLAGGMAFGYPAGDFTRADHTSSSVVRPCSGANWMLHCIGGRSPLPTSTSFTKSDVRFSACPAKGAFKRRVDHDLFPKRFAQQAPSPTCSESFRRQDCSRDLSSLSNSSAGTGKEAQRAASWIMRPPALNRIWKVVKTADGSALGQDFAAQGRACLRRPYTSPRCLRDLCGPVLPVKRQHRLVVPADHIDQGAALSESLAGCAMQVRRRLAPSIQGRPCAPAPDHHAVRARQVQRLSRGGCVNDVTISDDGNRARLL